MSRTILFLALASGLGAQVSDGGRLDTGVRLPCVDCDALVYGGASYKIADGTRANRLRGPGKDPLRQTRPGWWQRHLGDTAIHGAATTADIVSSRGLVEMNPLLRDSRGHLGARGIGIKLGIFAAVEMAKWRIARRHPQDRWVRALSLTPAALYVGAASHNWRIR